MSDKLGVYSDVLTRLVREEVACSPASWDRGVLSIQCDGVRVTYQLKNADHADKASISELLRDLIDELYVRMAQNNDAWSAARVEWWREGSELKFKVDFERPAADATPTVEPKPKQPWWKLGRR